MTDKEISGKERLKEALQLSDQTYVNKYPKAEEKIQYSDEYIKNIRGITGRRKPSFYKRFHRAEKSMIGLAATVLVIFICSLMATVWMNPITEFFETTSSDTGGNPVFQSSSSTQNPAFTTKSQGPDSAVGDHEHEFDLYFWYDENQHYARCAVEGCTEFYQDYHRYVHKPGKYHLECEFCGKRPK